MAVGGRNRGGGNLSSGAGGSQAINLDIKIEGLDRTTDEFKRIRREINGKIRDVMVQVGEKELLPHIRSGFPKLSTPTDRGLRAGAMAASFYVQRERSGVFIASRLRGAQNRALGWIDFGGKRPRDSARRAGTKVLLHNIDSKRALIDERVLHTLEQEFHEFT